MLSFNVADLLRRAPGSSERHEVSLPALEVADDVELAGPISGEVRLTNSGRSIFVQAHLVTALAQQCSRCLGPASAHIDVDIEEEALPSVDLDSGVALDVSEEPDVLRLTDHHELDLEPVVRDAISLAPARPCSSRCDRWRVARADRYRRLEEPCRSWPPTSGGRPHERSSESLPIPRSHCVNAGALGSANSEPKRPEKPDSPRGSTRSGVDTSHRTERKKTASARSPGWHSGCPLSR